LRVEHSNKVDHARMRLIFYAEPVDNTPPKTVADKESVEARWVSIKELEELGAKSPGLRGSELLTWGKYLQENGTIYPLSVFTKESDKVQKS